MPRAAAGAVAGSAPLSSASGARPASLTTALLGRCRSPAIQPHPRHGTVRHPFGRAQRRIELRPQRIVVDQLVDLALQGASFTLEEADHLIDARDHLGVHALLRRCLFAVTSSVICLSRATKSLTRCWVARRARRLRPLAIAKRAMTPASSLSSSPGYPCLGIAPYAFGVGQAARNPSVPQQRKGWRS